MSWIKFLMPDGPTLLVRRALWFDRLIDTEDVLIISGKTGKPENETRLVGTVSNCADAVRLETAPTGPDKSGSKPRGERVYLFCRIHHSFRFSACLRDVSGFGNPSYRRIK